MVMNPEQFKDTCKSVGGKVKLLEDGNSFACEVPLDKGRLVFEWHDGMVNFYVEGDKKTAEIFKVINKFYK